jgi:phage terminase large subunit-like protein
VTRDWLLWTHAWCHQDVIDRRPEIVERLRDFEKNGDLTICTTATQDLVEATDIVVKIRDRELLPEKNGIGLDAARIALMIDEMVKRGINDGEMCSIFQGVKLQSAAFAMERKLKDGIFWHGGQPMMAWCVGNAKVEQRRNDVLITKEVAGKAKIDPLIAAFNAAYLMSLNPEAARSAVSPWENPDFRLAAS